MAGRSAYDDPLKNFKFRVEIGGFVRAGFSECNGLGATTEVIEYREGGDNTTPRKSVGQTSYGNVTLRRGLLAGSTEGGDEDMEDWFQRTFEMNSDGSDPNFREDVDIILYHKDGSEAKRWRLQEAWVADYKPFPDLSGDGNEDAIEEITIAHEGFTRVV